MLFVKLGLFVELVLVGTSLVLDDGINGVKDLLVGFGTGDVSLPRSFSRQCRINHFVTIASNSSSHLSF